MTKHTATADRDGARASNEEARLNALLEDRDPAAVVRTARAEVGDRLVVSTSFGIYSAVMLHLVTSIVPEIPVVWIDTGYLPEETYRFAADLETRLQINLHVYQSAISPARMEALYGRLWATTDAESLDRYHYIRKVEPMQRALRDLSAAGWLTGVRRDQSDHRKNLSRVVVHEGRYKFHPLLSWSRKELKHYLERHELPLHPLYYRGYLTVGDWHSSRPMRAGDSHERSTRFHGIKQECGLHLPQSQGEADSRNSSGL